MVSGTTAPAQAAASQLDREAPDRGAVSRARAILPIIEDAAARAESGRRIPSESIDALAGAGLLRLATPLRFGGEEASLRDLLHTVSTIAEGDGSTGWVLSLINVCNWMVGLFPDRAQREVFGQDPDARVCGVIAPTGTSVRVSGGQRITGRWSWASGSLHAHWALVGVPIVDADGVQTDQGLALVPISDVTIEDTWFVAGMQGTGSNTLLAADVFVPDHRIMSVSRAIRGEYPTEHEDEPLYRSAFVPVLAIVLAAPCVGIARAAFAAVIGALAAGKGISHTFYEHAVDSGSTQIAIAEAVNRIDSAELHLDRAAADIDAAAAAGVGMDPVRRARVRMDTAAVTRYSREAVDLIMSVQGAGGFALSNPLQRMWRDINTAGRHAIVNPLIATEVYGRALLGVTEQVTPLV